MSIVRNINGDKVRQSMVKSLSEFCKNTGSKLIATGIETKEELNVLLSLDVSFGQGFFIGAPEKQFTKTGTIPYAFISSYQQNRRLLAAQKENMEKKSVSKRSSQSKNPRHEQHLQDNTKFPGGLPFLQNYRSDAPEKRPYTAD